MNISIILQFLKELAANNNRDWFNSNRERYEAARAEFEKLLTALITRISAFDDSIRHLQATDCTYRIYRDTRFSQDKTPYKTHMGGYINAKGKKSFHCGYYVHLEPGNCMLAGGSWCMPTQILKAVRQSIWDNLDEYRDIVEDPDFKRYFPVIGMERLKTAPKGFSKDSPYIDYVKPKDFTVTYNIPDSFYQDISFLDHIEEVFRQLKRFADFTNYIIDEME